MRPISPLGIDSFTLTARAVERYQPPVVIEHEAHGRMWTLHRVQVGERRWQYPGLLVEVYTAGKHGDFVRFDFGAEPCWTLGVSACLALARAVRPQRVEQVDPLTGEVSTGPARLRVSRVDLCRDVEPEGWAFDPYALEPWARGAPHTAVYRTRGVSVAKNGTLYIGAKGSDILCRVYLKTALETGLYEPTWNACGWTGAPVFRIEYQVRGGKRLAEYGARVLRGGVRENPALLVDDAVIESMWTDLIGRFYIAGTTGRVHKTWRWLAKPGERVTVPREYATPLQILERAVVVVARAVGRADAATGGRGLQAIMELAARDDAYEQARSKARAGTHVMQVSEWWKHEGARLRSELEGLTRYEWATSTPITQKRLDRERSARQRAEFMRSHADAFTVHAGAPGGCTGGVEGVCAHPLARVET